MSPSVPETDHVYIYIYIYATGAGGVGWGGGVEDVPLVELIYLIFSRMPSESYRTRLKSLLLCLCDVLRAHILQT